MLPIEQLQKIKSPPIDLTLTLSDQIAGVRLEPHRTLEEDGWNAKMLHLYSHCGTHMDAPYHFGVSEQTIDQLPPEQLMGVAWILRLNQIKAAELITPAHLGQIRDNFQSGESLLIQTDWSALIGTEDYRDALPRISSEMAQWCVDAGVRMLGVEPPSVADVNDLEEVTHIHQILLGGGVTIIEGLTNLDRIWTDQVFLIALPLKILNGDGAPARVIAFELE